MKKGIEVKELTMRFGNITALDRVDLILEENRIYGLLGRNGAGKSTLLNVIGNRLYPSEGAVVIDGDHVHLHSGCRRPWSSGIPDYRRSVPVKLKPFRQTADDGCRISCLFCTVHHYQQCTAVDRTAEESPAQCGNFPWDGSRRSGADPCSFPKDKHLCCRLCGNSVLP